MAAAELGSARAAPGADAALSAVAEHPDELVRDQYVMQIADAAGSRPHSSATASRRPVAAHPSRAGSALAHAGARRESEGEARRMDDGDPGPIHPTTKGRASRDPSAHATLDEAGARGAPARRAPARGGRDRLEGCCLRIPSSAPHSRSSPRREPPRGDRGVARRRGGPAAPPGGRRARHRRGHHWRPVRRRRLPAGARGDPHAMGELQVATRASGTGLAEAPRGRPGAPLAR